MSTEQPIPQGTLDITPLQATELARLVELHRPELVSLPVNRRTGAEIVITLFTADDDLRFVIDISGTSWRLQAAPSLRSARAA